MLRNLDSLCVQLVASTIAMGVIYKILKQQRHQQQQQSINMAKCKVQAAIRQRQQQRIEEQQQLQEQEQDQQQRQQQQHQNQDQDRDDTIAEQQLQQLCRFLAENAARNKRFKLQQQYKLAAKTEQQPLSELQPQDMDLLMEHLSTCNEATMATATTTATTRTKTTTSAAPRDSILLKIRHQIFERKRQRQRQLAELVKQRLVVWRPW